MHKGAILLPGIEIGEEAFVAAGSLVTRDVPPRTLVVGAVVVSLVVPLADSLEVGGPSLVELLTPDSPLASPLLEPAPVDAVGWGSVSLVRAPSPPQATNRADARRARGVVRSIEPRGYRGRARESGRAGMDAADQR